MGIWACFPGKATTGFIQSIFFFFSSYTINGLWYATPFMDISLQQMPAVGFLGYIMLPLIYVAYSWFFEKITEWNTSIQISSS